VSGVGGRHGLKLVVRVSAPAFCNVFLGRLNSFVADHDLGSGVHTGQRALRASWENVRALREAGVASTVQIAASIRNGPQAWDLVGCDVLTISVVAAREVADGEIPDYALWKDRLTAGEVGPDSVFNLSGLRSFAADQRAMDDRIRSLLAK